MSSLHGFSDPALFVNHGSNMKNDFPQPTRSCELVTPCVGPSASCHCCGYPSGYCYQPVSVHRPNQFLCGNLSFVPPSPYYLPPDWTQPTVCGCKRRDLGDYHGYAYSDLFNKLVPESSRDIKTVNPNCASVKPSAESQVEEAAQRDAATHIQSVYRGHLARRWKPLKKLKQLAEIQQQYDGIEKQIEDLILPIEEKQTLYLGETIMKLLLKLDSVQDLHPSYRDMRKSLARKLTFLQEKLDAINMKESADKHVEEDDKETKAGEEHQSSMESDSSICTSSDLDSCKESSINQSVDQKLLEENERLRQMMQKLITVGEEHIEVISDLYKRVCNLERKLPSRRKKVRRIRKVTNP